MRRIVAEVQLAGRIYTLVIDDASGRSAATWWEGNVLSGEATAFERALALRYEEERKKLVRVLCDKNMARDCFDCPNTQCEWYWGEMLSFRSMEDPVVPPKKQVKAAIKRGTNPYAVAQAMVNKGKLAPAKKEDAVKSITKSVLGKGKSHGKSGGKRGCK